MTSKILVALAVAALILIILYACLAASSRNEQDRYRDDWAQWEWACGKEEDDGSDPESGE